MSYHEEAACLPHKPASPGFLHVLMIHTPQVHSRDEVRYLNADASIVHHNIASCQQDTPEEQCHQAWWPLGHLASMQADGQHITQIAAWMTSRHITCISTSIHVCMPVLQLLTFCRCQLTRLVLMLQYKLLKHISSIDAWCNHLYRRFLTDRVVMQSP